MPVLWFSRAAVLGLAAALDWAIGDPWVWPHPVQAMGRLISLRSNRIIKLALNPWAEQLLGVVLGLGLVVGSVLVGWGLIYLSGILHPVIGLVVEVIVLARVGLNVWISDSP